MSEVVFAAYRPHEGKDSELKALIEQHMPVLRELGLITDRPELTLKSKDGTYIEVIEWQSGKSAQVAHEHPKVPQIWESMAKISEFRSLGELPEAGKAFNHFQVAEVDNK